MTLYNCLKLLNEYHLSRMNRTEKKFIKDMWEAVQGIGEDPTDQLVEEHSGISSKRAAWVWQIAKNFMITKKTKL